MTTKKIYLGADHAGFHLKERIKHWLDKHHIPYQDLGNVVFDTTDDYPDFAEKVARKTVAENSLGILICGSAQGVGIAANKIKGVRAVIPFNLKEARLSREHTNANILCLSGWFLHFHRVKKILEIFLTTPFSREPRHQRRLAKIHQLEKKK